MLASVRLASAISTSLLKSASYVMFAGIETHLSQDFSEPEIVSRRIKSAVQYLKDLNC
jgi:hypothetical protein